MMSSSPTARVLTWLSGLALAAATLAAACALLFLYAIRAPSLGAHDLGIGISSSVLLAITLTGLLYAIPVLLVGGALSWFFQRASGYRLLAAAALCALPLAIASFI